MLRVPPVCDRASVINKAIETAPPGQAGFIDEVEMLKRLPVSRRTLFQWRESGKIPFVRVSGRRLIFHWPSVEAALLRAQRNSE